MELTRRSLLAAPAAALAWSADAQTVDITVTTPNGTSATSSADQFGYTSSGGGGSAWYDLKIGGGGYVIGMDVASDGTMMVWGDVYGIYIGSTTIGAVWRQLVNTNQLGSYVQNPMYSGGGYEARFAPSNSSVIYMIVGGYWTNMFVSQDKGVTFTQCAGLTNFSANANTRANPPYSKKMAVHPTDPSQGYFNLPNGTTYKFTNYGATITAVAALPTATGGVGTGGIAYDPTNANRIIVPVNGTGAYITTNGGTSWSAPVTGPTTFRAGKCHIDGTYWALDMTGNVWRLTTAGVWSEVLSDNTYYTIACDPGNVNHVIVTRTGGYFNITTNANAATPTWTGVQWGRTEVASTYGNPWQGSGVIGQPYYMSDGELWFDPNTSYGGARLWFSWGFGVSYSTAVAYDQIFYDQSTGIEELVACWSIWPPFSGSVPLVICEDLGTWVFNSPTTAPSSYGPVVAQATQLGCHADWASQTPTFVVTISSPSDNWSDHINLYYALDGGVSNTWTEVPVQPTTSGVNSTIACATTTNWVYVSFSDNKVYVTANGGTTAWTVPASLPTTGWQPNIWTTTHAHLVCADRVNIGTFYAYNSASGIWSSTNGGSTWTNVYPAAASWYNTGYAIAIQSVPGQAGHLFAAQGAIFQPPNVHPVNAPAYRSINGGSTWTDISNSTYTIREVYCIGFGQAKPGGGGYPSILIIGWVNGVFGYYQSDDDCTTWTKIGDYPNGWVDIAISCTGNMNAYGDWVVTYQGSGAKRYGLASGY